jgi:hypothetical protein
MIFYYALLSIPALYILSKLPTTSFIFTRLFGTAITPAAMSAAKTKAQKIIDENAVGRLGVTRFLAING